MWRSRLGELLENDPKKAAEALKRLNSAERIRLWAFEAMDRRRNIYERILFTDAKQHEQSDSWPETRLIFSAQGVLAWRSTEQLGGSRQTCGWLG